MRIALIGYGLGCNSYQLAQATELGQFCAQQAIELYTGGYQGVFEAAILANFHLSQIFLEKDRIEHVESAFQPLVSAVDSTEEKHQKLAEAVDWAFVIGGGPGSAKIVSRILALNKPVFVDRNSGGLASELTGNMVFDEFDSLQDVLAKAEQLLP